MKTLWFSKKDKMKKIFTIMLRAILGLSIVGFLVYKIDITKILDLIVGIDWFILPVFFLASLFMLFAGTLNIKLVLNGIGEKIKFKELIKENLVARSIGSFLPGRLGEGSLAYLLKKKGIGYGKSLLALIIDKFITFIVVGFFSVFVFFVFFSEIALELMLVLVAMIAIGAIILLSNKLRCFIKKFILRKYAKLFTGFSKGLFEIIRNKKRLLFLNFLIKIGMMVTLSLIVYFLMVYFGADILPWYVLIIHSAGMLSAQIPISMAGLGIRESVVVYLYYQIGVDPVISGTIYLLFAVFSYLLAGSVLIYNTKRIKIGK